MRNKLLALMDDDVAEAIDAGCSRIHLGLGDTLPADDLQGNYVFLMEQGVISHCIPAPEDASTDVGIVGAEGIFPFSSLLGVPSKSGAAVAQLNDVLVCRVDTDRFIEAVDSRPAARQIVNRFIYSYLVQIYSNFVASQHADICAQAARWILMCHDRLEGDELCLTHDMLAQLTGCLRPTVSKALAQLKKDNAIDTGRGRIIVLDREKLRERAQWYYGHAEAYWQEHLGDLAKDDLAGKNGSDLQMQKDHRSYLFDRA